MPPLTGNCEGIIIEVLLWRASTISISAERLVLSSGSSPKSSFKGNISDSGSAIRIYHKTPVLNIDAFKKNEESYTTSDEEVKRIHGNMGNQIFS